MTSHVWSEKWQMSFNLDKCKVMHNCISAKIAKEDYANERKLAEITEERDFGVIRYNLKRQKFDIKFK
jgi:hypothetical protein